MNEENNNQPVVRRSPLRFLFYSIFIVGIVLLFVYACGGFNQSATLNTWEFMTAAMNNDYTTENMKDQLRLYSAKATTYGDDVTVVTGVYSPEKSNNKYNYSITFDKVTYIERATEWQYYSYRNKVNEKVTTTIFDVLNEKYTAEKINGTTNFVFNNPGNAYQTSWFEQWGPTLLMLAGSALIVIFLFSRMSGAVGASNRQAMDFNKSRARRVSKSKTRFDDVAGADEEKTEMKELVDYLKDPRKFAAFGAKLPKGVLLVGPPGCGKTLLAKAVAGEAGVPFYSISGSDFVEMFVGVGAGRVRDMFKIAKENAPCLVFIDEIDAVGRQRGAGLGGGNDEREQTLNQLLVEMDGFSDNAGIIVIAATNRDDVLDPALLRAGRFDRKITVSLPDRAGREAIFKVHSRNKNIAPDVDFDALARRTVGFSGADIENIMNEAAILCVRRNKQQIGIDEIDEAIDRRIAGPAKSSKAMNAHEREIVAFHESGHAIIGLKYPHSDKVQKITIIPRGNTGGHVRMTPEEDRFLLTKNELEARIVGYLGGRASEAIFFDDISSGAQNDIEMATHIARMMVTELGMSELGPIQYERVTGSVFLGRDYTNSQKNFSTETATKIDAAIREIIETSYEKAKQVITKYKKEVTLIANTLLEHEQITAEEIDYLLENGHLKRDEKPVEVVPETPVEEEKTAEEKPAEEGEE